MIRSRPIVLAVSAAILALAGATSALAAEQGARSASPGPTVNLTAVMKRCAVVHVALHGSRAPAITCLRRRVPSSVRGGGRVIPDTGSVPCNGAENINIQTKNGQVCYSGSGYLGISPKITLVLAVSAESKSWMRLYYNGVGSYFNFPGTGGNQYFGGPDGPLDAQNVAITQVCDSCGYHA